MPNLSTNFVKLSISIHAPRVGCDLKGGDIVETKDISIHAPRVGCDPARANPLAGHNKFQSTHPGWGATTIFTDTILNLKNFNPRTPGGVRLLEFIVVIFVFIISIHAPRVGCDTLKYPTKNTRLDFNPRTPGGVRLCSAAYFRIS